MSYVSEVQADNPVAWWRLGEPSGLPQDSAGTNHVTAVGSTPTYAVAGALTNDGNAAMTFDGATEYLTVPDAAALDVGDACTYEFWAKRADAATGYQLIYAKGSQGNVFFLNNKLTLDDDTGIIVQESGTTVDTNWHHFVVSRVGTGTGNTKIYKDGADVTTEVGPSRILTANAAALTIGRYSASGLYFNGSLDEIAVYPVSLSAARALAHYNAGSAAIVGYNAEVLADNPVAYWRFGEASGNPQDSVGTNHATVTGGTPTYSQTGALVADANTAILLDGATEYFDVPDAAALDLGAGPLTYEFWAKRSNSGIAIELIYSKKSQGNVFFLDDKMQFDNDVGTIVRESGTTTDTAWHHWAITRTAAGTGNTKLYKDGADVTTEASPANALSSNATVLTIGRYNSGSGLYFDGALDEMAVYASALSATRILAHYNAGLAAAASPEATETAAASEVRTIVDTGLGEALVFTETATVVIESGVTAKTAVDAMVVGEASQVVVPGTPVITVPEVTARIDWWDRGVFTDPLDEVTDWLLSDRLTRGRSTDHGSDAIGSRTFRLRNDTGRFTPDRNWHDNPSFEVDTAGWSVVAIAALIAAGTSIAKVVDNAPSAGSSAGEAVLPATLNAGVAYAIPHKVRAGVTYQVEVYLKSMSGSTSVEAGLGSSGTPTDRATSSGAITTSWAAKTFVWTPTADRDDVVFFVRTAAASAATARIDRVQINPGASVNAYLEAPTKGQLIPGRPVHLYATWLGVDYPLFFGHIERISPIPLTHDVEVVCYDQLRRYQETDILVPAHDYVQRSARDFRREILEEIDRGDLNLLPNPSFETDLAGWTNDGGTLTRITTDAFSGSACAELVALSQFTRANGFARQVPVTFAGVPYRFSVYLRQTSGSGTWKLRLGYSISGGTFASKDIVVDTTWRRYSITYTPPTSEGSGSATPLRGWVESTGASSIRLDAAMITRGPLLFDYSDAGADGRRPNWCGNGSFDGGALNGWKHGFGNLVGNGSFEVDAAGWSVASNVFHSAATSITRSTAQSAFGAASGLIDTISDGGQGAHYAITGTFFAGVTYDVRISVRMVTSASSMITGIGSVGTPTDKAQATSPTVTGTAWVQRAFAWTPTADRTDVQVYVQMPSSPLDFYIDGAVVTRRDSSEASGLSFYLGSGPNGGLVSPTSRTVGTTAKYGARSLEIVTPATAKAGMVYDFAHWQPYFVAGQAYTFSVWVRVNSGTAPIKVGLAAVKADGTIDEASATDAAVGTGFVQITGTWTPAADYASADVKRVVLYICQTDATARTIYVDGVRVIPGSSADEFELAHWILAAEDDGFSTGAELSGNAFAALGSLNKVTLSRHYVRPTMVSPFYEYVVGSRDDLASKTSRETIVDTGTGGLEDLSPWQLDRGAIVNIVPVTHPTAVEYYSDQPSVDRYGPRPTPTINGAAFYASSATADEVGPALLARYKDPRARPQLRRSQLFPNLLARQVDDLITVSADRLKVYRQPYLIVIWELEILEAGLVWRAKYGLEEMP